MFIMLGRSVDAIEATPTLMLQLLLILMVLVMLLQYWGRQIFEVDHHNLAALLSASW